MQFNGNEVVDAGFTVEPWPMREQGMLGLPHGGSSFIPLCLNSRLTSSTSSASSEPNASKDAMDDTHFGFQQVEEGLCFCSTSVFEGVYHRLSWQVEQTTAEISRVLNPSIPRLACSFQERCLSLSTSARGPGA